MAKKDITRRDFLKGMTAGAMGLALAGSGSLLTAKKVYAATYAPGTYTGIATGIGTVVVTMTFSEEEITDVDINLEGETATIGGLIGEDMKAAILAAQSSEVDSISGATLSSKAVMEAAESCIRQAKGEIPVVTLGDSAEEEEGAADWLGEAPEIADSDISETWDTDFLVVGAGNGGLCAAAYCAKQGVAFRVIEKGTTWARNRGWYGAVNTKQIVEAGGSCDKGAFFRETKKFSSGKADLTLYNTWFNESADMHYFIEEVFSEVAPDAQCSVTVGDEAKWPDEDPSGLFFPVEEHFWTLPDGGRVDRNELFTQYIKNHADVDVDYSTAMIKLETDENGKVTGVIAQNTDTGAYIRINAAKGVLLACGGYPYNPKMMEQLDPMGTAVTTYNNGWPTDTGDGIKAACWIGGALQPEAAPMLFDRGIVAPGVDAGYHVTSTGDKHFPATYGQMNVSTQPFLKVNRRGERFTNEAGCYDEMSYAAYGQPGGVYAVIFDADMPENAKRFHTIGCSAQTRNAPESQLAALEKEAENGEAFICDTIEELADKLGFEGQAKETFLATVERQNELYAMGEDVDFGKPFYRMSEIKKAPFYGFWTGACLLTTEQGILCDDHARVKKSDGSGLIDNLFVCGDNAGGFFYNNYPCIFAGIAMGRNMTFAIKAVKTAFEME